MYMTDQIVQEHFTLYAQTDDIKRKECPSGPLPVRILENRWTDFDDIQHSFNATIAKSKPYFIRPVPISAESQI
jgi:hypothetical protein